MSDEYTSEELTRFDEVAKAIDQLDGIKIPYDIIKHNIIPFRNWLKTVNNE